MESSTVLAFRIFVMLSCLIIVPMAAIFGSAFPDVVKTVLVDRIVAWSTGKPLESKTPETSAPSEAVVVGPGVPAGAANQWEAPRWPQAGPGGQASNAAAQGNAQHGNVVPASAAGVYPSIGNQSAGFTTPSDPRGGSAGNPLQRAAAETPIRAADGGAQPRNPFAHPGNSLGEAVVPPTSGSRGVDQPDRFTAMERKLREYGATYYLLETWGNEGQLYRFHCRMAINNNPNYTRQFEATDRDALKAMLQVLERVEAWRTGRLQ